MVIQPLTLLNSCNAQWTVTQEKTINREYPFTDLHLESSDMFVARTYLQFLWLPESIMPLHLLVPSLQRVQDVSPRHPDLPHPLHTLLDPLLLSVRSATAKYHVELPQVLADNGGAGEAEESMMWFALNYEKMGGEESKSALNNEDAVMMEEKFQNSWLERLERREVQIQILLYFLKLSLPGPCAPLPPVTISPPMTDTITSTKKKHRKERPKVIVPSTTERLESFMDKLSTWQLVGQVDVSKDGTNEARNQRDWMQSFCEDIVERQFKLTLPNMCTLLHSKVFPQSPFANETDKLARSPSPSSTRPTESVASGASIPHRAQSVVSNTSDGHSRSRSRSLSVSLAQDASARRANSTTSTSLQRALSREVSMSRGFKSRAPAAPKETEGSLGGQDRSVGMNRGNKLPQKQLSNTHGITLVAATPTKPRTNRQAGRNGADETRGSSPSVDQDVQVDNGQSDNDGDEEMWLPDSSPDILLLGAKRTASSSSSSGEAHFGEDTPVKKRKRLIL